MLPCRLGSREAPRAPEDRSCRWMKKRWGLRNRCCRRPEEAMATDGEVNATDGRISYTESLLLLLPPPPPPPPQPAPPPLSSQGPAPLGHPSTATLRGRRQRQNPFPGSSGRPCSGDPCNDSGHIYSPAFLQANPIQLDPFVYMAHMQPVKLGP